MKFKKYLNETGLVNIFDKLKDGARSIVKDCKPYIKENPRIVEPNAYIFSGISLWRGYRKKPDPFLKVVPRKNRKPVDVPEDVHNRLNKLLYKKFGWHVRSEGVFATGDKFVAGCYGSGEYIMFPIGKYKYVWSPKVFDMWEDLKTAGIVAGNPGDKTQSLYTPGLTTHEKVLKDIVDSYTDKNLVQGIGKEVEITIKCKSYYLLDCYNNRVFLDYLRDML